ncbi:MAG: hypothetical protein VB055_07955 [Oscillospiraceae bacterium]|nr:hypothetical protein [Oscillospiraceae bacterium]
MKEKPLRSALGEAGKFLKKFRYAALVLLLGAALLLIPTGNGQAATEQETETSAAETDAQPDLEERLAALLSQVEGAGRVCVMLTVRAGEETVYQTDSSTEQNDEDGSKSVEVTTVLTGSDEPVTTKILSPVYLGAVVVAEGGDLASVRLNLVSAVSSLTGLGADKITVMKMKAN